MDTVDFKSCDVLVIGSGLSGLRSGISALETDANLHVTVASSGRGPSGASFTNINQSLGMVVCRSDKDMDIFTETAVAIACPGSIRPELTAAMARESQGLFDDLVRTGFKFKRDDQGDFAKFPCCFLKDPPLAHVFTDLSSAFHALKQRFLRLGGLMMENLVLQDLIQDGNNGVSGALFLDAQLSRHLAVKSGAMIVSTGGAAGLFLRNLTGKDNLGFASALMKRAGARFVNMAYVQFLWYDIHTMEHWPCWRIASQEFLIRGSHGQARPAPPEIRDLCAERSSHVPLSHGRSDSAVDDFLVSRCGPDGVLDIICPDRGLHHVALFAHAMNGGVLINDQGQTSVKGLFACGECAGGMHGANRIGGAMVLSTQVFGKKSGIHAARFAGGKDPAVNPAFTDMVSDRLNLFIRDDDEWSSGLGRLRALLSSGSGPAAKVRLSSMPSQLREIHQTARDFRWKLALETALTMAEEDDGLGADLPGKPARSTLIKNDETA